jgi:hypothetical protein
MATKKSAPKKSATKKAATKSNDSFELFQKAFLENKKRSEFLHLKIKGKGLRRDIIVDIESIEVNNGAFGWPEMPSLKQLKDDYNDQIDGLIEHLRKSKLK